MRAAAWRVAPRPVKISDVNFRIVPKTFLILLLGSLAVAQTRKVSPKELPHSAFKLISVSVTGSTRYTQRDIISATGLEIGKTASEEDFRKATRELGETGLFSNVAYAFHYSTEGTKLEFQLADNTKLVPARFDNFVWFSDQELLDRIRARVPLFKGELPVAGGLVDQVSDALQGILIERNIEGRADYLRSATDEGPIDAIVYSVNGPSIRIRNVLFEGAAETELPALQSAAAVLRELDYHRSTLRARAEKDLLPVYRERGYLKASLGEAVPKVAQDSPEQTLVDITFSVNPGRQYKLHSIQLAGYKAFSADELRKQMQSHFGGSANGVQLSSDIESLKRMYEARGYMEAEVQSAPEFDDEKSQVTYRLYIKEGELYKMGDLEIRGLDGRTTVRLEDQWKLRGGDPFNGDYPAQFLQQALKQLQLMGDFKAGMHIGVNHKDKTVDVTLSFDRT